MRHPHPIQTLFAPLHPIDGERQDVTQGTDDVPSTARESIDDADLLPVVDLPRTYVCPGEKHAIPRSIHLARLAAFYPNCRHCEHRSDTGQLPRSMVGRLEQSAKRVEPVSLFRTEGIRGVYLNQLTRNTASRIAAAVADRLWSGRPLVGRIDTAAPWEVPAPARRGVGPTVVLGQDSRTSSPDLSVGVSESLRHMGCEVVDVGRVSRPCLSFAVEHLQADAGLYVTGSLCPDAWTGLDVVGAGGLPWSAGGILDDIERRYNAGVSRPTRHGGTQRFFDASIPYRASLLKHFQEPRPLKVALGCIEPTVVETMQSLFDGSPCELIPVELTPAMDDPQSKHSIHGAALRAALRVTAADCAALVCEDGQALQVYARSGRPMPTAEILPHLIPLPGSTRVPIAVAEDLMEQVEPVLRPLGWTVVEGSARPETMARWMQEEKGALGVQSGGRIWFRDTVPRCDAAVTLGHLLQEFPFDAA